MATQELGAITPQMVLDYAVRPLAALGFAVVGYMRLVRFVTSSILLPSSMIGKNKQMLEMCVKQSKVKFQRKLVDKRLDVAIMFGDDKSKRGYLIYANANGVCYEHILRYTNFLGQFFNRKVVVFNYSGVGNSRGSAQTAQDLVNDMTSVVRYVESVAENKKDLEDVVLWGHSIGGAVALLFAGELSSRLVNDKKDEENGGRIQSVKVVCDRSFSHLRDVVKEKISIGPMAPIVSGLLASSLTLWLTVSSLIGFSSHVLPSFPEATWTVDVAKAIVGGLSLGWVTVRLGSVPRAYHFAFMGGFFFQVIVGNYLLRNSSYGLDAIPCILMFVFAVAFELGMKDAVQSLLGRMVEIQGWTMNPRACLEEGLTSGTISKVIVTSHEFDEMISPQYSMKVIHPFKNCYLVDLDGPQLHPSSYHMYDLNLHELEKIKALLASKKE